MHGNYQNTTSNGNRRPPRTLVFRNRNRTKSSGDVNKENNKEVQTSVKHLEEVLIDKILVAEAQPKPVRAKPNPQQRRKNKLLKEQESQEIEVNSNAEAVPPTQEGVLSVPIKKKSGRRQRKKKGQHTDTVDEKQTEESKDTPTIVTSDSALEPKSGDRNVEVNQVCKTMEQLHIKITNGKSHLKHKRRTRKENMKKPIEHKWPPQMKDISSEDVYHISVPSRQAVPQAVADLYRRCALREGKNEPVKSYRDWTYYEPINYLRNAVHVHPSEDREAVIGMVLKNNGTEVIIRVEGPLHDLDQELRYLLLTQYSTVLIIPPDGAREHYRIPLDQLLIGSRIVINEIETELRKKEDESATTAQLFDNPTFHVMSFSPYAVLHDEIGLCIFSRREQLVKENGKIFKWLEMELLGPSFRRPFKCSDISCYVKDSENESWDNWGHNFICCAMWRLPFIKTQCFDQKRILTIEDQDPLALQQFEEKLEKHLESETKTSRDLFTLKTELSLVGIRLISPDELDLIHQNYKIPLNNVRQQELYIRDVYLSVSLLEEHVYSSEVRKRTLTSQVSGRIVHDSRENRKRGLMHMQLDRGTHKRLFMESSTASWDKNPQLSITALSDPDLALYGFVLRDQFDDVGLYFDIEMEQKSVESWSRILESSPHPEVTIGPLKRRQDLTSKKLYKKFASLRYSKIHKEWLKCEGYAVDIEGEQQTSNASFPVKLDASQQSALDYAIGRRGFSCITAATGTGKTLITVAMVNQLLEQQKATNYKPIIVCAQNNSGIDRIQENFEKLFPQTSVIRLISSTREHEYPCDIGLDKMCNRAKKYLKLKDDANWPHISGRVSLLRNPILQKAIEDINLRVVLRDPELLNVFSDPRARVVYNNDTIKKALQNTDVFNVLESSELAATLFDPQLQPVFADLDLIKALNDPKLQQIAEIQDLSNVLLKHAKLKEELLNSEFSATQYEQLLREEEKTEMEMKTVFLANCKPQVIIGTVDMLARHNFESETVIVEEGGQFSSASMLMLLDCMRSLYQIILVGDYKLIGPFNLFRFDSQAQSLRALSEMERITQGSDADITTLNYSYRAHPKLVKLQKLRYPGLIATVPQNMLYGNIDIPKSGKGDPFGFVSYPINEPARNTGKQCRVEIVEIILKKLAAQKVKSEDIVVLSYLKVHSRMLRKALSTSGVEICTVDSFQGRESRIVIVLAAFTQHEQFSNDRRRLTVAISRAREYLYIIGPQLQFELPAWKPFSEYAESRGAFLDPLSLTPM